ncbi:MULTISPECIES: hypothetical protein [unclassified Streptomyces]|uniref:hypothetical protein n=1 Tax=unclassified Streptomyces TaxID=2593676 RepID=UPI001F034C5F|nr:MULTISPECIES: hypothetical protein [unclassified Streptomyces]MCH0566012.1 hypothetical protein [Streptomyces sp. MUM 2J]MCH0571281.1 hypothetical protein [Streptomyces sp. MUM 136J]
MAQPALALGTALLTFAGSVWYLPALADVRAGADRPDSRRSAAAACLSGWATLACLAVALLLTENWRLLVALAATGSALTAALRIRAAVRSRREARESARHWAELRRTPPRGGTHDARTRFAVLLGTGLTAAAVTALLLATGTPGTWPGWTVAAVPALLTAAALALASGRARAARRHTTRTG